jgi:hypothetical protein
MSEISVGLKLAHTWIRREAQRLSSNLAENRTLLSKVFAAVNRFFEVDTASASDSA